MVNGTPGGALEAAIVDGHDRFLAFVRNRVSDPEMAQDILQDGIVKALGASGSLRNAESVVPWFYRILRNAITDSYRQHRPPTVDVEMAGDLEAGSDEYAEFCRCFTGLLPSLKADQADLLQRLEIDLVPVKTEAERLGVTPATLKVRRHRARQALRKQLELVCHVCADHHCLDCTCKA